MTEEPLPTPVKRSARRIHIRRRLFALIGLLSLVSVSIGLYAAILLKEANTKLTKNNDQGRLLVEAVDQARTAQVYFKKQVQEWKDILLRGSDKAIYERHFTAFQMEIRAVRESMQTLKALMDQLMVSVEPADKFLELHEQLNRRYDEALKTYDPSDPASCFRVDRMVQGIDRDPTDRLDDLVDFIRDKSQEGLRTREAFTKTKIERDRLFLQGITALIVCSLLIAVFFGLTLLWDLRKTARSNRQDT